MSTIQYRALNLIVQLLLLNLKLHLDIYNHERIEEFVEKEMKTIADEIACLKDTKN